MPQYNPNHCRFMVFVEVLLVLINIAFFFLVIIAWGIITTFNNFPWFPGNTLPSTFYYAPVNYLLPFYTVTVMLANLCFVAQGILIYGTNIVPFMCKELMLGQREYRTRGTLRKPENLIQAYRQVQLLQMRIMNDFFGKYIVPSQAVISLLFVFNTFVIIKRKGALSNVVILIGLHCVSVIAPTAWVLCLYMGGYVHSKGICILRSWKCYRWKDSMERRLMNKFRLSCVPLAIRFGSMYTTRKVSVLLFIKGISRGLARAFLTLDR